VLYRDVLTHSSSIRDSTLLQFGIFNCVLRSPPQLLVPLPPTPEQSEYNMAYRTLAHIHNLDTDSLLQMFSCYRLEDEDNWNLRHAWRKLAHVCRRWRFLIFNSWSHLDMCLFLTNDSPSLDTLSHLPPLSLIIDYSDRTRTITRKDEDNIHLGLQQHGRVRRVALLAPYSSLRMWLEPNQPMSKRFPKLRDLSLLSTTAEEISLVLPETLQAPDLRRLSLHGVGLPKGLSLLSSAVTLSTLSLTHIGASSYLPPGHLVTHLRGLPHLEELFIGFAIPIPLPSSEGELLPVPIPPVTLPSLRRLTFRGVDVYLENLVAQINTPLLERFSLTFFFDLAFTFVNLTEFIHRAKELGCVVARVIFNKDGASIYAGYYEKWGIGKFSLHVNVNCEPLDWQMDSATQICGALGNILSAVEELTLDLDVDGMPLDWENTLDNMMWHELLLPFIGVKKLHIGSSLTPGLSQALESVSGELALELLSELQALEVPLEIDLATKTLSMFMKTRESVGRPVHLLIPSAEEIIRAKRLQNTLAAQRSRRRKLAYQRELEDAIDAERKEKEMWEARALALEELRDKSQN
jgi:hypothetical protein